MKPGQVIVLDYMSNKNILKKGMFLIFDTDPKMISAFKITSKTFDLDEYSVKILKKFNSFLNVDSYVQTNKRFTFDKTNVNIIGTLSNDDLLKVSLTKNLCDINSSTNLLKQLIKGGQ